MLLALLTVGSLAAAGQQKRPNIVFFLTDDQDQVLGGSFPHAAPNGATPLPKASALLAAEGATSDAFYIHTPICCPSRAETFTGRYLQNVQLPFVPKQEAQCTAAYGGFTSDGDVCCMHVDEGLVNNQTFAVSLAEHGYSVGFFGKTLNNCPLQPFAGVDAWLANGGGNYFNPQFAIKNIDGVPDGMQHFDANTSATLGLLGSSYSTSVIGNYSLAWITKVAKIAKAGGRPFMAYIGTKAPHDPFDPAPWYTDYWNEAWPAAAPRPPSWNMTAAQLSKHHPTVASQSPLTDAVARCIDSTFKDRWRSLMSVDDLIGAVVTELESMDLSDSTYFLYSSDHGYQLGELNLPQDKRNVYDFDTRIHLLARGPGIQQKSSWAEVASNVDIGPTILSLAGIPVPRSMDGKSFARFIVQPSDSLPASVQAHLAAVAAETESTGGASATWRDTHYIKHNAVGAGNYPTQKPPNCGARPHGSHVTDDAHFVDQPDNNFIAIRHRGSTQTAAERRSGSAAATTVAPASGVDELYSGFSAIYREARSISTDFLYAEFNWNNREQFPHQGDNAQGIGYNGSLPLQRHLGTNNLNGGWESGWSNDSNSSPGSVNFTEPFFFELFDMETDPWQMDNIYAKVAAAEPKVVAAMHQHVQALHVCAGASCP